MNTALNRTFVTAALAFVGAAGAVCAQAQTFVPAKSEVQFTSRQMGVPVDGRFKKFDAQLRFDPKQPQAGSVKLSIDTGSASFGAPEVDLELPKATWFDVAKHPRATFESTRIKPLGNQRYEVAGTLTIKGVARPAVVPVALTQANGQTLASGQFTVKRLEHQIGAGEWADTSLVANEVQVSFKLAFTGIAPQ